MMLKLSVIVPVYNVEEYLPKCLDSLIVIEHQSEDAPMYEILIVDDGSTDSSGIIADEYAEKYPALIRVIHTENGGIGSTRNTGVSSANGEYLLFIDSDDYLIPGAMDEILSSLNSGYDICIFDTIAVNVDGKELKYMPGCAKSDNISLKAFPELLLEAPHVWNKICRKSLYTENNIIFPSALWYEDLYTVPKLYCFADKIMYVPKAWHRYLQRKGSILNSRNAERNIEIIPAVDSIIEFYKDRGRYYELKDVLEYLAFHSQFLTASVRVCLANHKSPVLNTLIDDFIRKFPDFNKNKYIRNISRNHRLLSYFLQKRNFLAVKMIMSANSIVKRKKV